MDIKYFKVTSALLNVDVKIRLRCEEKTPSSNSQGLDDKQICPLSISSIVVTVWEMHIF